MASSLPTPVAAALGLVPVLLDRARAVPTRVAQVPALAVTSALTALGACQREYGALAERGEQVIARVRGTSFDELEDQFEEWLVDTPLEGAYEAVESTTEDLVAQVEGLLDRASRRTAKGPKSKALPLSDYPTMTLGALRGKLRTLTPEDLESLREHEQTTQKRSTFLALLDNRINKLRSEHPI